MNFIACSTSIGCGSSLELALDRIQSFGISDVDLLTIDGWVHVHPSRLVTQYQAEAAQLRELLDSRGLRLRAMNSGVSPQLHDRSPAANTRRTQETQALVRLCQEFEVRVVAIQPRNADASRSWEEVLSDCVASVREQVAIGAEGGVQFALELHVHSPFETLDQARRLLEAYPDVPLVFDPSHFILQGIPFEEIRFLMPNAKHAHVRDCGLGEMQTPYGQGNLDVAWVVGALREAGYRGSYSLEYLETDAFEVGPSTIALHEALRQELR